MSNEVLLPLTAAGAALLTAGLTFLAAWLKLRSDHRKHVEATRADYRKHIKALEHEYEKSRFQARLAAYSEAWRILGRVSSLNLRKPGLDAGKEFHSTIMELHEWYNEQGGMYLSPETRDRYFELREVGLELHESTSPGDMKQKIVTAWHLKMDLRNSLRYDVGFETILMRHTADNSPFPGARDDRE